MAEHDAILVVEDDEALREMIVFMLEDAGYAVRAAEDGVTALAAVDEAMPSLILLDLRMAGMDGWAFAREFDGRHGRAAPIIVCTAALESARHAAEVHADALLDKPFKLDELLHTVERFGIPKPGDDHLP